MNIHLKKIAAWATLLPFLLIMPQTSNALSDADCTSLKILRATSCVDILVSGGLIFADTHKSPHTLALARASALTALCHKALNNKKIISRPLRVRDWLTIGGCITKNVLRASTPFIKNSSARMAAYSATMLLELGAIGHASYSVLDDKNDMQHYYLACLASLGLQAFIQGKALQVPATQPTVSLLTPTEEKQPDTPEETPSLPAENQSPDQTQLSTQRQELPKPPIHEKSLLQETDLAILGTCSEENFKQALYKDVKKTSELAEITIDFSDFNNDENCNICAGDKTDNWIFSLNEKHDRVATFCHVSCLAKHFATEVTSRDAEVPQGQISDEEIARRYNDIYEQLSTILDREPTNQEIQRKMHEIYETKTIPGKLPRDPFSRNLICETWENYFIYPKA